MAEYEPIDPLAAVFEAQAQPVEDDSLGQGERFMPGNGQTQVDVFPDAVRVTIMLTGQPETVYWPGGSVGFIDSDSQRMLAVRNTGEVLYKSTPSLQADGSADPESERLTRPSAAAAGTEHRATEGETTDQTLIEFTGVVFARPKPFERDGQQRLWIPLARYGLREDGKPVRYNAYVNDESLVARTTGLGLTSKSKILVRGYVDEEPPTVANPDKDRVPLRVVYVQRAPGQRSPLERTKTKRPGFGVD